MAEMKLGALGLDGHLDLEAGAYGESHEVRAELVHLARDNAARRYGTDFSGAATVLVGDTPLDVAAALETGARAVAVATGGTTAARLAESGAHAVLPDLTDTPAVLAAILTDSMTTDDNPRESHRDPSVIMSGLDPHATDRVCRCWDSLVMLAACHRGLPPFAENSSNCSAGSYPEARR